MGDLMTNSSQWAQAIASAVDNILMQIPSNVVTEMLASQYDMELNDARRLLAMVRAQMNSLDYANEQDLKAQLDSLAMMSSPLGMLRQKVIERSSEVASRIEAKKRRYNTLQSKAEQIENKIMDIENDKAHTSLPRLIQKVDSNDK